MHQRYARPFERLRDLRSDLAIRLAEVALKAAGRDHYDAYMATRGALRFGFDRGDSDVINGLHDVIREIPAIAPLAIQGALASRDDRVHLYAELIAREFQVVAEPGAPR